MNCAIYPRKSKANDNSQSMEQQIAECENYINTNYPGSTIYVYGGDYALTGHSTAKRKDFQRMMSDVRSKRIQLVVIMRYDRIARNMRDFCNLYHDIEEAGCNLVSVSQQIDTSTPYGKNFMYQMAAMAELEWAIISERYKDTAKYKREHGYAYTGRVPFGYKIEMQKDGKKRVVKNPDRDAMLVFQYYLNTGNKMKTVEYIQDNYYPEFTYEVFRRMLKTDMYIGSVNGNANFCEPYLTREELDKIRNVSVRKCTPSGRVYMFSGLIKCPICHETCYATTAGSTPRAYYRCGIVKHRKVHDGIMVPEERMESDLLARLDSILGQKIINAKVYAKNDNKSNIRKIEALQDQLKRIDYMFEKGRISSDVYDKKYSFIEAEIASIPKPEHENYENIAKALPDNWRDIYSDLDAEHRSAFWHQIIDKIVIDKDKNIDDVIFKV